jgi:hypothetical protein
MAPFDDPDIGLSACERASLLDRARTARATSHALRDATSHGARFRARVVSECLESAIRAYGRDPTEQRYGRLALLCRVGGRDRCNPRSGDDGAGGQPCS